MKGDFTRSTFTPAKRYSGVRQQQGRVQLDADWNEQIDIDARLRETSLGDLVGRSGAPRTGGGFKVGVTGDGSDLTLAAGRLYVDGVLLELLADTTYSGQLASLDPALAAAPKPALPSASGTYFVYADAWQRHVTALEDPAIRETALGGPDTATRTQTFWQVKLLAVDAASHCLSAPQAWLDATAAPTGKLRARTHPGEVPKDPCIVPADAGYTRLENQLYRVEVHKAGVLGGTGGTGAGPTFKWSRDNGSVVSAWQSLDSLDPKRLTVQDAGRDKVLGFATGQFVEVTDDVHEIQGQPGVLAPLQDVLGTVLTFPAALSATDFPVHPKVRLWGPAGETTIARPAEGGGWLPLEGGIEVRFEDGTYRTGDYWLIPARAFIGPFSGDIEWPQDGGGPAALPPHGVAHHLCKLAVVDFDAATKKLANVRDCRLLFPAATEHVRLFQVGGDGQAGLPGGTLACPLEVGVSNGWWPVPGARVEFKVAGGSGTIDTPAPGIVLTGPDGVARCLWTLPALLSTSTGSGSSSGTAVTGAAPVPPSCLSVTATLRDVAGNPIGIPVVFHAAQRLARHVAYEAGACDGLAAATTVQEALDILCKGLRTPGIGIRAVRTGDGKALANDTDVTSSQLQQGLQVICDQPLSPDLFSPQETTLPTPARPNVQVNVYLPHPLGLDTVVGDFSSIVGFQPMLLGSTTAANGATIGWKPSAACLAWLKLLFGQRGLPRFKVDRLLVQFVVKGNFVWSATDPNRFLDGDVFGQLAGRTIGLSLPSGDGRRGGDFEMWFWLVADPPPTLNVTLNGANLTGKVADPQGAPLPGVTVTLTGPTGQTQTAVTNATGDFAFANVPIGQSTVQANVPGGPALTQTVFRPIILTGPPILTPPVLTSPVVASPAGPIVPAGPQAAAGAKDVANAQAAAEEAPAPPLTAVAGIGPVRAGLLAAGAITTPAALAAADPARVAELLGVSEAKAAELIAAAKVQAT